MCSSDLSGSKKIDARIASFFYENGIAFSVADSTSFISMIDESIKFAKQNPLQSHKTELTRQHSPSSRKSFRGLFALNAGHLLSNFWFEDIGKMTFLRIYGSKARWPVVVTWISGHQALLNLAS